MQKMLACGVLALLFACSLDVSKRPYDWGGVRDTIARDDGLEEVGELADDSVQTSDETIRDITPLEDLDASGKEVSDAEIEEGDTGAEPLLDAPPVESWDAEEEDRLDEGLKPEEVVPGCTNDEQCDDGNPCTKDYCDQSEGCLHEPIEGDCEDGNLCTDGDHCQDGECVPGEAVNCNDGNPCTSDQCDPVKGCVYAPNEAACDDKNACTVGDHCENGSCVPGQVLNCDDNNPCTNDSCDETSGCVNTPVADGTECDDHDACTTSDQCKDGKCVGGPQKDCDDNNVCTKDLCVPTLGCVYKPVENGISCDDGDACTSGETCVSGACTGGKPLDCDNHNPCTKDSCDPTSGCVHDPAPLNGTPCNDGNDCTDNDKCTNGDCKGVGLDCDDNNPCTDDSCDPSTQKCKHTYNSGPCDDGNPCTINDKCSGGACSGTLVVFCTPDGNPCTSDECQEGEGCTYPPLPNETECDDGNPCTENDHCSDGTCKGSNVDCNDGNQCTKDSCDPQTGCHHSPVNNGTPCNDQNNCTYYDQCYQGKCGGIVKTCDDGNVCTDDSCNPDTGLCDHVPNNAICFEGKCNPDGSFFYLPKYCQNGECPTSLQIVKCDDGNVCTDDFCDVLKGGCYHVDNAKECDDGNPCTYGDTCSNGVCQGTEYSCEDPNPECLGDGNCGCCRHYPVWKCVECDPETANTCVNGLCKCGESKACKDGHHCDGGECVCGDLGIPCPELTPKCCYNSVSGYYCSDKDLCQ